MRLTILCSILATLIAIVACGTARVPAAVDPAKWSRVVPLDDPAPPTKAEAAAAGERDEAQHRVDHLKRELADAELARDEAKDAEAAARKEAILAPLRRIAAITAATALVGLLACIALWFILPAGTKRAAIIGGCSCLAVLVAAVAFHSFLPYLAFAGGTLVVSGVAWFIWRLAHTQNAVKQAAAYGERIEDALRAFQLGTPEQVKEMLDAVKASMARAQEKAGVRKLIAGVRGKPIPPIPTPDLAPTQAA